MKISRPKKITALLAAAASVLTFAGFVVKTKRESGDCACDGSRFDCGDTESSLHVPEPSVKKVSRVRKLGKRKPEIADSVKVAGAADALKGIFDKVKDKMPSNESIAKIIMSLINLQNAVSPERAIDVRGIRFMKSGNQNTMVIDLYTTDYGKPAYEDELSRLWDDIFLAENFWNADFVRVRVNVRCRESGESLETISCSLGDVSRYLLEEISLDEFQACWNRRKSKAGGTKKPAASKRLKRA